MSLRVGVVGLGAMGLRHVRAARSNERFEIAGGSDTRSDPEAALLEIAPGARFTRELDELLAMDLDVLVIATTAPSHFAIFERAARAGVRRMLVEKPLAISLAQADAMRVAADRDGIRVAVNISRRYAPVYRELAKRVLADDLIGTPASFSAILGASGLACNGTHVLDLGTMLLGRAPIEVAGRLTRLGLPNPRGPQFDDPGAFGWVLLEDGRRITVDLGDDFGVQAKYQLVGRYGRVVIDEIGRDLRVEARDAAGRTQPLSRIGMPLIPGDLRFDPPLDPVDLARRALEDVAGEGPIACDLSRAIVALELVVGFHLSDERGGAPVRFDQIGRLAEGREFQFT